MKLEANGIEIHYTLEGDGPVVTLSHALGCDLSLWDDQARGVRARYRVLRFDTRGHGQSAAPAGPYTLEGLAADVHGLLTGLGIDETHFVGISMGGMIGQTFALAHPEMVRSLVLCDTTSRYPASAAAQWQERIRAVESGGMEAIVEPMLERWFTPPYRHRRPDTMARVGAMLRSTPVGGYVGCCHALPAIDVTDRLGAIRCPTLVIVGEEDAGTPVKMAREIHAALPGAALAIVRAASHLSNVEQPEEFTRVLLSFLDRASGRSAL
jgi:3-oxoadipate enol-lactonase